MKVPFFTPDISSAEIEQVEKVLQSGWITTGPKTKEFETELSQYMKTGKTVCLNSATAAMELTLRLLGIGEGDEVITSAYTYTASASVICHVGATPVLVDTDPDSYHISKKNLQKAITSKTKAIIPVDIAGVMCDYESLYDVIACREEPFHASNELQECFGRPIIVADGAHSFGAFYDGKISGQVADFTSFSFHAVKNLTTGEGGAVTWKNISGLNDEEIYKRYMLFSLHGQTKDALSKNKVGMWEYDIVAPYYKCNMTDIAAAIGGAQLKRYEDILAVRRQLISIYDEILKDAGLDILPHYTKTYTSSGHLYLVRVPGVTCETRNLIITKMAEAGISTNVHYKPLPLLTAYKALGFRIEDYPNAYAQYENEITLPLFSTMTIEQVEYVANTLCRVLEEC